MNVALTGSKSYFKIMNAAVCALLVLSAQPNLQANDVARQVVSREELRAAMQRQTGYDPTATTNVARFQAEVLLHLARQARERDPDGPPLLIRHDDWFWAFLDANRLTLSQAPHYSLQAWNHQQDQLIDYNLKHVIKKVERGPSPQLAVNVKVSWPDSVGLPSKYSFEDTLATPKLNVTNHRVITYRLLDFGDMIVYDEIQGLTGRPTSGILGLLFRVIGEGEVSYSRITISDDGLQITRARAQKGPIVITETVTVQPDGKTEKGLPSGRRDLQALEKKLKRPLRIRYVPIKL
jgi:hypothetical protein